MNELDLLAIVTAIVFVILVIGAHIDRPELGTLSTSLSTYFTGRTRAIMFLAYGLLAVSLVSVGGQIFRAAGQPYRVLIAIFCVLAAICLLPAGVTTRRVVGDLPDLRSPFAIAVHRYSAISAFLAIVVAMVIQAISRDLKWQNSALIIIVPALAGAGAINFVVLFFSRPGPYYGLIQKSLVLIVVAWIISVSTQLTLLPPLVH